MGAWHRDQNSLVGELAQWEIWVELAVRSQGRLHVFEPMLDRGIDALVHRMDDGRWFPIQAKGRSKLRNGSLQLTIHDWSLVDPKAIIIGVALEDDHPGLTCPGVHGGGLQAIGSAQPCAGQASVCAQVSFVEGRPTRWARFVFPLREAADALLRDVKPAVAVPLRPPRRRGKIARAVGFRGEMEVGRRPADSDELTLFRPIPDLETAEMAVLHEKTRRVLGIQVKTIGVDKRHAHNLVDIDLASFRPFPDVWIVVVAWDRDSKVFRDECLVIPSLEVTGITAPHAGHLRFSFAPGSRATGRLDPYRRPLADLGALVEKELGTRVIANRVRAR